MSAITKEGQIILAVDPCQLVPVVFHNSEVHKILRMSLLERFMTTPIYRLQQDSEDLFNPAYVTMFTKSYRLPPFLLEVPSKLFYHDQLRSMNNNDDELLRKLDMIKNKDIPLLFHGIKDKSFKEDTQSWCNIDEAVQCVRYFQELRRNGIPTEDIGIISLYRKQVS